MTRRQKDRLCNLFCEIFQIAIFLSYWIWSTFYFFHTMCRGADERNVISFIGCALTGWFMAPFVLLIEVAVWLSTIQINW